MSECNRKTYDVLYRNISPAPTLIPPLRLQIPILPKISIKGEFRGTTPLLVRS